MYVKIGGHLIRFSVIVGLSLASLLFRDAVLVSHDAQARQGVRSVSVCTWKQLDWSSMSSSERQLWSKLGWTQSRWDSDSPKVAPASDSRSWAELSSGEKNAASQLGFSSKNWEATCSSGLGLNSNSQAERSSGLGSNSDSQAERSKAAFEAISN